MPHTPPSADFNPERDSKILKVTIEYEGHVRTLSSAEAEKWQRHNSAMASLCAVHNQNPFDTDPVEWEVKRK